MLQKPSDKGLLPQALPHGMLPLPTMAKPKQVALSSAKLERTLPVLPKAVQKIPSPRPKSARDPSELAFGVEVRN